MANTFTEHPIFDCVKRNDIEELKRLLENGENIDIQNENGHTPLQFAARYNYKKIVVYLLEHGANISIQENAGYTPLHTAVFNHSKEVIKCLLEPCSNPNIQNHDGQTFLDCIKDTVLKEEYVEMIETYSIKHPEN